LVSALAVSKNASCCRCAKRRAGIRNRYHPLPSSRPLARSLCGHTRRSRLADGEAGKIPCVGFYGDRIGGTSRSGQSEFSSRQFDHHQAGGECLVCQGVRGVPLDMSRTHPECPDSYSPHRSEADDLLLRQEPDEEEDEEEDEGDRKKEKEDDDDDDTTDNGYSE